MVSRSTRVASAKLASVNATPAAALAGGSQLALAFAAVLVAGALAIPFLVLARREHAPSDPIIEPDTQLETGPV